MPKVTIYSTPVCSYCDKAKTFFKANDISYTEIDVASDSDARAQMVEKSGKMGVPQIYVGDDFVFGFDEVKLRELLNLDVN